MLRRGLFEGLGHLLIGQLDLLILWTGGGELFPGICIAQVPMHSTEHLRDGESPVLLTYHLESIRTKILASGKPNCGLSLIPRGTR